MPLKMPLFKLNNFLIKAELIYTCISTVACHSAHKSHFHTTDYLLWGGTFLFTRHCCASWFPHTHSQQ